jgi:nitrous oxidase accessory protein NosD
VNFRGTSQSIVLSGSSSVTNGLLLDSGASGSVIRNIAFSSFSSDAIRLTSTASTSITGIRVSNSGNGLAINGTSANTVVQGNTFDRNQTGVSLVSATGALIGGMNAGQGNVISSAVRQGVFASGFCTGSQVVKNTFPGTATPYNVSASRNLTIVN